MCLHLYVCGQCLSKYQRISQAEKIFNAHFMLVSLALCENLLVFAFVFAVCVSYTLLFTSYSGLIFIL